MTQTPGLVVSFSLALTGSGGAGVMTAGAMVLDAAAKAGWYGLMTRAAGPQIRGGEAAALIRLATREVGAMEDHFHLLVAVDWMNVGRFAKEIPLTPSSLILADPTAGPIPPEIAASGARVAALPMKELAKKIKDGRQNMIAVGAVASLIGLSEDGLNRTIDAMLGAGSDRAVASRAAAQAGREAASVLGPMPRLAPPEANGARWMISGNEAAGLGAIRGGVRFVAAYPITPATEMLEWMTPALTKVGGVLVQAEDELASINMTIGASYAGLPSLTATSGPGLALMVESLGLAIASETPIVVVDVMRGGPSTGIPTKSEQSDLNIAVHGMHGDAPHLVLAPNSVPDCLFTTQWAVHLAERMQVPAIVLSDQYLAQARAVIEKPADVAFMANRERFAGGDGDGAYRRYAVTSSGVSPMAIPGARGGQYTADGLEHNERGTPSSQASDHGAQLDKRLRKLTQFDYGQHWAEIDGEGEIAVVTWGSTTAPVREAIAAARAEGARIRLIAVRLLAPLNPELLQSALAGAKRTLVVELSHSAQFHKYLRAHCDLPGEVVAYHRPGPLPVRPGEILQQLKNWC